MWLSFRKRRAVQQVTFDVTSHESSSSWDQWLPTYCPQQMSFNQRGIQNSYHCRYKHIFVETFRKLIWTPKCAIHRECQLWFFGRHFRIVVSLYMSAPESMTLDKQNLKKGFTCWQVRSIGWKEKSKNRKLSFFSMFSPGTIGLQNHVPINSLPQELKKCKMAWMYSVVSTEWLEPMLWRTSGLRKSIICAWTLWAGVMLVINLPFMSKQSEVLVCLSR